MRDPDPVGVQATPARPLETLAQAPGGGDRLARAAEVAEPLAVRLPASPGILDAETSILVPPGDQALQVAADRAASRATTGLVVSTSSGVSAEGGGASAGLTQRLRLGRGVSVSAGGVLAYARFDLEPQRAALADAFNSVRDDPATSVDVAESTTLTALAFEVPLDLRLEVARVRRARVGLAVGLTSALYLTQTFRDQGQRVSGERVPDPTAAPGTAGDLLVLTSQGYTSDDAVAPFSQVDLAQQLSLAFGVTSGPDSLVDVDVFARLPLGGLTRRDLPLTTVGIRLLYRLR